MSSTDSDWERAKARTYQRPSSSLDAPLHGLDEPTAAVTPTKATAATGRTAPIAPLDHERAELLGSLVSGKEASTNTARADLLRTLRTQGASAELAPATAPATRPAPAEPGRSAQTPRHNPDPRANLFNPFRGRATRAELVAGTFTTIGLAIACSFTLLIATFIALENGDQAVNTATVIIIITFAIAFLHLFGLIARRFKDAGYSPKLIPLGIAFMLLAPFLWVIALALTPQEFHNEHGNFRTGLRDRGDAT